MATVSPVCDASLSSAALGLGHERRLQQQVFGRVAGERELGEEHHVAHLVGGGLVGRQHPFHVACEVTDHAVDLCARNPQPRHVEESYGTAQLARDASFDGHYGRQTTHIDIGCHRTAGYLVWWLSTQARGAPDECTQGRSDRRRAGWDGRRRNGGRNRRRRHAARGARPRGRARPYHRRRGRVPVQPGPAHALRGLPGHRRAPRLRHRAARQAPTVRGYGRLPRTHRAPARYADRLVQVEARRHTREVAARARGRQPQAHGACTTHAASRWRSGSTSRCRIPTRPRCSRW